MIFLSYMDSALLIALLLTLFIRRIRALCNLQGVAIVVGCLIPVILIDGLPVYQYLRSVLAELSIVTKILILTILYQRFLQRETILKRQEFERLKNSVAFLGIVFYPLALGVSMFDPYAFGYQATALVASVALLMLLLMYQRVYWTASILSLALVGYYFNILESDNFWDYLLDPVLWLYCLVSIAITRVRSALGLPPASGEPEQTAPSCST